MNGALRALRFWRVLTGIAEEIGTVLFIGYVLLNVSSVAVPLLVAIGVGQLVDGTVSGDRTTIMVSFAVLTVALMLSVLSPVGYRWTTIRIRERSVMVIRRRIMGLSIEIPRTLQLERPEYWNRSKLLQHGADDLAMGAVSVVIVVLMAAQLVAVAVLFGRFEPWLALAPLVAIPASWLAGRSSRAAAAMEKDSIEDRRTGDRLFRIATEPASAREAGLLGLSEELVRRHRAVEDSAARATNRVRVRSIGSGLVSWILFALAYFGAALVIVQLAERGAADAGDVALVLGLVTGVVFAAGQLGQFTQGLVHAWTSFGHYCWLEDQSQRTDEGSRASPPIQHVQGLRLEQVGFRYQGREASTLEDISIDIPAGAVVAIVGESGAGKTTLAKILSGLYSPTTGHVLFDGTPQESLEIESFRRRLSICGQDFTRFELSVADSVGVGDVDQLADTAVVTAALDRANADFVASLPEGIETQLGSSWQNGVDLSGGEWQKVAVARALMRPHPLLVVFDEPSAALDPQSEHHLFEQLKSAAVAGIPDGRITVLISHRFSTVQMADLILVLQGGRLVDQGSHVDLMARPGLYAELYRLQVAAYS